MTCPLPKPGTILQHPAAMPARPLPHTPKPRPRAPGPGSHPRCVTRAAARAPILAAPPRASVLARRRPARDADCASVAIKERQAQSWSGLLLECGRKRQAALPVRLESDSSAHVMSPRNSQELRVAVAERHAEDTGHANPKTTALAYLDRHVGGDDRPCARLIPRRVCRRARGAAKGA